MQSLAVSASALSRKLSRKFSISFFNSLLLAKKDSVEEESEGNLKVRFEPKEIGALCRLTKFSRKEIQRLYRGFKQECPRGFVTEATFKEIFANFFPQSESDFYAQRVFKLLDQDFDGCLNFEDLLGVVSLVKRGSRTDQLQWIFSLYDVDGDGFISCDEMTDVVCSVHALMGTSSRSVVCSSSSSSDGSVVRDHVTAFFQKMDKDEDGVISLDEFMETCRMDSTILQSLSAFESVL